MYFVNKLVAVTFLHTGFVVGELYKGFEVAHHIYNFITNSLTYACDYGDACSLKNGNNGICKFILECPEAIAGIRKGIFPAHCGFEGTQVIVCCAQAVPKLSKTTARPSNITTKPPDTTTKPPETTTQSLDVKSRVPGVTSNEMFGILSKYVWKVTLNPTLLVGGADLRRNECPFNRQELIVGGAPASRREFPHMVQFGYESNNEVKWTCSGSLISNQYVLTAAHCMSDRSLGDAKFARMGIVDLEDDDHMQQVYIAERIPYPDYEEPSYYHDIGLIKLNQSVELNTWVRPACLYTNSSSPWSQVIACGWGKIDFAGPDSSVLLKVILEFYDQPKCNKTYGQQVGSDKLMEGIKDEIMVCAGHSKELKDTCQGDSGGPLQVYRIEDTKLSECMYDIVGITSFGKACGFSVNLPAVYTRVSHYVKWIEDIVWPPTT